MPGFSNMRIASGITFFLGGLAFAASLVCLFSGTSKNFMTGSHIMTLNISQLGQTPMFKNTTNCKRGFLSDFADTAKATSQAVNCTAENRINSLLSSDPNGLTDALKLPDFFDVHVLNFCQGTFNPRDYVLKRIADPGKNIASCTDASTDFSFNPTQVIRNALPSGIELSDIYWPSDITNVEGSLHIASKILVTFYSVGLVTSGLTVLMSIWGILRGGDGAGTGKLLMSMISFLSLAIASVSSSIIVIKATSIINSKGATIGIAAKPGPVFISLTWLATAVLLIAAMVSASHCVTTRRRGHNAYVAKHY